MSILDTIRIGPFDFALGTLDPEYASDMQIAGRMDPNKLQIDIVEQINDQRFAEVLLHEILHAAFLTGGIEDENEEQIVSILALQLLQILRDNPAVVEVLTGQS